MARKRLASAGLQSEPAKPGPVPKGKRAPVHFRMPVEHRNLYEAAAKEAGLPLGDYLVLKLSEAHKMEPPEYVFRNHDEAQGRLQLPA